ncbi:MAG TPA: hypothetical protein VFF64_25480 [Candidatus Eremiobacteraceae bacterium]|nr:hypothetical protein [Candidatus Eremiobacteraceae bacterium]
MIRAPQPRSQGIILTPAAPPELVQKGMETVKADLTARFNRQREEDARSAGLIKKLAQLQREVSGKSGVDVAALAREVRQFHQKRAPKQPFAKLPGLQSEVPLDVASVSGYSVVTPPYNYNWSATAYVDYAPGTLTANANQETGNLNIDDECSTESIQVNISNAQAAVGIYFKPQVYGVLSVQTIANISEYYYYVASWTGANTRGWAGFLVQGYDATNSLVETPVYQQNILFDEGSNGGYPSIYTGDFPNLTIPFLTPSFVVSPSRWYAIWFWCGGDIHAQGDEYDGDPIASYASSVIDVTVPYFLLYFQPKKPPRPR